MNLMGLIHNIVFESLFRTGVIHLKRRWKPRSSLLIPGFHQINTPHYLKELMGWTMTPDRFRALMEYVAQHYKVVTADELEGIVAHKWPPPENALAITFDDGYRDVYDIAFPILQELNLPATVFVTTGSVDNSESIWTNKVYYYFHLSRKNLVSFQLPDGSTAGGRWSNPTEKRLAIIQTIQKLKTVPSDDVPRVLSVLASALGVNRKADPIQEMPMLDWDQIREMHQSGLITIGSHTVSHPILSKSSIERQTAEIVDSKKRIEQEIDSPCTTLAYPNGQRTDVSHDTITIVKDAGYKTAYLFSPETAFTDTASLNAPRQPIMASNLAEFAWVIS